MENFKVLEIAKRLQAISQMGLTYSTDGYNLERYEELAAISHQLIHLATGKNLETIRDFYMNAKEYPTPKTDIRAVVLNEKKEILLVREKEDNNWSLPGGWADIGYSPAEVAIKEVWEETGFHVKPYRLLAVLDKKFYNHPAEPEYVYKFFINCIIEGGEITTAHDINEVAFFSRTALPALSVKRVVPEQIELMFDLLENPGAVIAFN